VRLYFLAWELLIDSYLAAGVLTQHKMTSSIPYPVLDSLFMELCQVEAEFKSNELTLNLLRMSGLDQLIQVLF
jgi:hypothetical protein